MSKPVFDIDPNRADDDFTEGEEVLFEVRELAEQILSDALPITGKVTVAQRIIDLVDDFLGIDE